MTEKSQQEKPEQFTIINNYLIETDMLTEHEKIMYIVLRKHLNQTSQTAFPGLSTIVREARTCRSVAIKAIKGLEKKGVLSVTRTITKYNQRKTNIYRFNDCKDFRNIETADESKETITETSEPMTDDEILNKALLIDKEKRLELYNQLAKEFEKESEKEKESETLQTIQNNNVSDKKNNKNISGKQDIIKGGENQVPEKYTLDQIRQFFNYNLMIREHPCQKENIDSVIDILHTTMNTRRPVIRIAGEDRPVPTVIEKLMKLNKDSILYAIEKFSEQKARIKNPVAYMLTLLYKAPEQYILDKINQKQHDIINGNAEQETHQVQNQSASDNFSDPEKYKHFYDKLKKLLLDNKYKRQDT